MLSLLLASQLQLPVATQETGRHLAAGIPSRSLDDVSSARVALWISEKGKVRKCRIVAFAGDREIAEVLCREMIDARFKPARDPAGHAVPSLFTTVIGASDGNVDRSGTMRGWMSGASAPADVVVNLSALTPELRWNPSVAVNVMINDAGRVVACEGEAPQISPEWIDIACREVSAGGFEVMASEEAQPVTYIRNLVVKFEAQE